MPITEDDLSRRYPWQWNPPEVKPTMKRTVPQILGGFRFPNLTKKNRRVLGEVPCVFCLEWFFHQKFQVPKMEGFLYLK